MSGRRWEPLASSTETENVRAVRGGCTGEWVLCQVVHFGHFPVHSVVHLPSTGRESVNTFRKGAFRTAMTSPNVGNDIGRLVGAVP